MRARGPAALLIAWALHDVEEAVMFPSTCERLAERTGLPWPRMDGRQSWVAVGLMGTLVAFACRRRHRTGGRSRLYRAVTAGLEGHVATHLLASAAQRSYTAGVATAFPVMLPGALVARHELRRAGIPLRTRDSLLGAAILIPAALACHALARLTPVRGAAPAGRG
ncbi:HXXEE domain-containing protein [Leucobacter sp. CSA1]|uniref:HXXEE domain-containing protein n=1 Tax=Leucobacter chromiisoli TaxID=2796471 RepID=A0A934Q5X3_9MICO|nr:HXXEE domain-containing protein [Leucobacter chromiisoli]MBK0418253.1 HXXEE domain-containing protein [Leucobacter chromiisoli]